MGGCQKALYSEENGRWPKKLPPPWQGHACSQRITKHCRAAASTHANSVARTNSLNALADLTFERQAEQRRASESAHKNRMYAAHDSGFTSKLGKRCSKGCAPVPPNGVDRSAQVVLPRSGLASLAACFSQTVLQHSDAIAVGFTNITLSGGERFV